VTDAVAMIISPRLQQAYRRCVPMFPMCFLTDRRRPMKRDWLGPLPGDHRSRAIEAAYLASRPNSARQVVVGRSIGA
jgi:hypothetical protein